jgi:adenosylmethionine-8-amino-7-oxononanoate aminotransferase
VICRDFLAEPFLEGHQSFAHGLTFGGHPVSCAVGLANLDVFDRDAILDHVQHHEQGFRERLEGLRDVPLVGDVRGAGYFFAIELVRDQTSGETFRGAERDELLRTVPQHLAAAGLISRVDGRGDPVIQVAPPLVAGPAELDELEARLREALTQATRSLLH